jgi:hypothetical protein
LVRISKNEAIYLTSQGVSYGEDGIVSTTGHHKSWYMTESKVNKKLLKKFRETNNCRATK